MRHEREVLIGERDDEQAALDTGQACEERLERSDAWGQRQTLERTRA